MIIDSVTPPTGTSVTLLSLMPSLAGVIVKDVRLQGASGNSTNIIYVGAGTTSASATTSKGYELGPSGVLSIQAPDKGDVNVKNIWVIASGGTPRLNVAVQEQ